MFNFKKITEFLKKVGSRDTSATTGKDTKNAKNASNVATEIPSAFADKSSPVSNVLKGLPPNASKQDVLLHIRAMVERRSQGSRKTGSFSTHDEFKCRTSVLTEVETLQLRVLSSTISQTEDGLTKVQSTIAEDTELGNVAAASTSSGSRPQYQEGALTVLADAPTCQSLDQKLGKGDGGIARGEIDTPASIAAGASECAPAIHNQVEDIDVQMASLEQERAELIEALDVCLQEVPEMDEAELHEHIRQCIAKHDAGSKSGNKCPCPDSLALPSPASDMQPHGVAYSMRSEKKDTTEAARTHDGDQSSDDPAIDENAIIDGSTTPQPSSREPCSKTDPEIVTIYEWRQLLLSLVELLIYTETDILYKEASYAQRKGQGQDNMIFIQQEQQQQKQPELLPAASEKSALLSFIPLEEQGNSQKLLQHSTEANIAAVGGDAKVPPGAPKSPTIAPAQNESQQQHSDPTAALTPECTKTKADSQELAKSINKILSSACSLAAWVILRSMLQKHIIRLEAAALKVPPSQEASTTKPADKAIEERDKEFGKSDPRSSESPGVAATAGHSKQKVLTVDWPEVVNILRELLSPFGPSMAECVVCATFLRDDGLELMMCMLQVPYARALIEPIIARDKQRQQMQCVFLNRTNPTGGNQPEGGIVCQNSHISVGSASGGGGSSSGSAKSSQAAPSTGGSSSMPPQPGRAGLALPSQLLAANLNTATPVSIPDGPTLDDLLAEVELAYKEGVLKSWAEYLKQMLFVRDEDDGRSAVGAFNIVSTNTSAETPIGTSEANEGIPEGNYRDPTEAQSHYGSMSTIDCRSTSSDRELKDLFSNVGGAIICQFATAFFFCSDEWKGECRRARFDFLHCCMHKSSLKRKTSAAQEHVISTPRVVRGKWSPSPIEETPAPSNDAKRLSKDEPILIFTPKDRALILNSSKNAILDRSHNDEKNLLDASISPELANITSGGCNASPSTLSIVSNNPCSGSILESRIESPIFLSNVITTKSHHNLPNFNCRSTAEHQIPQPALYAVGKKMLAQIAKMSWAAALHKRVEHCITDQPPSLELASRYALEEHQVAGMLKDFRARQRALNSILKSHLSAGRSHEALAIANKHFKNERKEWSSRAQTIFSAMQYLQSMVQLVQAQAACHAYGAVIETGQFVLLQCDLCEQMLQVISPKPRGAFILRFGNARVKLINTKVYLTKELWYSYAMFNNNTRAEKLFDECIINILQLRKKLRDNELFDDLMKRGKQLMDMKEFLSAVELFKQAVNISSAALKDNQSGYSGGIIAIQNNTNNTASGGNSGANPQSTPNTATTASSISQEPTVSTVPSSSSSRAPLTAFSVNLHLHRAGSSDPSSADEHTHVLTPKEEEELELTWKAAESQRMLALAFVTQAEHEVNVQARRVQLSNAVNNAYASQASLQKWQAKGGTPKRMLTAVPSSLIVIAKALLLLGQPKKAALLLEPLIEAKPNAVSAWPPMWAEILDPTTDPLTAEDIALRIYVNSVRIAVFQLYGQCLSKFDGERALRVVERTRTLLKESFYWMHVVRRKISMKYHPKSCGSSSLNSLSKLNIHREKGPLEDPEDKDSLVENASPEMLREMECSENIENRRTDLNNQAPSALEEEQMTINVPNLTNAAHPHKKNILVHEALDAEGNISDDEKSKKVKDLFQRIDVLLSSKSERVTALRALHSGCLEVRKAHCEFEITAGDTLSLLGRWEDALEAYFRTLVICLNEDEAAAEAFKRSKSMASRGGSHSKAPTTAVAKTDTTNLDMSAFTLDLLLIGELNQEFDEDEEEEEEIVKWISTTNLSTSTGAKDLRAVLAHEEHMKCKVCENMALSRIANVYKALGKHKIAIQYLSPVLEYAKECNNALLEYQSMLSLSRLYTITEAHELAQEMWKKVSALAKRYEDKEVSRETMRNIVTVQEAAMLFSDVIRTAEELRQLALAAEGSDATADLRYALEALANAHLQLAHYKECIEALNEREKVQEKSGEWNGKLLELRACARLGNGEVAEAIKILSKWVNKARQLQNLSELGRANAELGAAYVVKGDPYAAHRCYLSSLQSFSRLKGVISHQDRLCIIKSAHWLVHNYYLNNDMIQVNVELPQPGTTANTHSGVDEHANKRLMNYSIFGSGGEVYENGLHNQSGDLAQILEEDEKMRSGSGLIEQDQNYFIDNNIDKFLDSIQNHSIAEMNMYLDKDKNTSGSSSGATSPAAIAVPSNQLESNSGELSPRESSPSSIGNISDGDGVRVNADSPISFEPTQQTESTPKDTKKPVSDKEGCLASLTNCTDRESLYTAAESKPQASSAEEKQKPPGPSAGIANLPTTTTTTKHATAIPSTTLTNVSMCSRPAAAIAGTDVLSAMGGSDAHNNAAACAQPGKPRTSRMMTNTSPSMILEVLHNHDECHKKRPSKVSTLCYLSALKIMDWTTRLICGSCTNPHCRYVIPYSPAESVDLVLLAHPRCIFVFFFAEYVTESSSSYDVIIRPANHSHFMHRNAQVTTLKEYCNKKLLSRVAKKATKQTSTATDPSFANTLDKTTKSVPLNLTLELISGEISSKTESVSSFNKRSITMCDPNVVNASGMNPALLERALEDEIRTQLGYLYDELWRPVQSSFRHANLNLSDAECLIIVVDPSLLRVPFHALLPSPENLFPGDSIEPIGQQATLVVTPSVSHLIECGVSRRENGRTAPQPSTTAPDHKSQKIIFLPEEDARANSRNINPNNANLTESEPALQSTLSGLQYHSAGDATPTEGGRNPPLESLAETEVEDPFSPLRSCWSIHAGCTRKEFLSAFADPQNRVIMALNTPVDDRLKVADGVIGLHDLASARAHEAREVGTSTRGGAYTTHGLEHLDLLVITVDRGVSASATEPVGALSLCLELRCARALLLDVITGTAINAMHKEFLVLYLKHLDRVKRCNLKFPYALALRMTLGMMIEKGWPVTVWGAFTLVGAP